MRAIHQSADVIRIPPRSFTDAEVRRLKPPAGKADHIHWDPGMPGFGVRTRAAKAVYVVQYRFAGATQRESLGDVRKLSVDEARKIARQFFAKVELGMDPREERRKAEAAAEADRLTFKVVVDLYLKAKATKLRARTHKIAGVYFRDKWGTFDRKPIGSLDQKTVAQRLREIIDRHGATAAARARGHLSALFTWAMKEGLVDRNPVIATHNPVEGLPARDRVLSDEEVRILWRACQDDDWGRIVRLLLLTACRRDEIGRLRWSEVDPENARLLLPAERTKSGRAMEVPLVPTAKAILQAVPRPLKREFVFGAWGEGYGGWSFGMANFRAAIAIAEKRELPHWTLHDLRRTVRTGMSKLGVQPHIAELVLNHVAHKSGVVGVYDHHSYQPEIADALARWEKHLLSVVA